MTREEMITLRMNLLGGMDAYIRDKIGDDIVTDVWNMYGVPDGADEDILREIAEDDAEWTHICKLFGKTIKHFEEETTCNEAEG